MKKLLIFMSVLILTNIGSIYSQTVFTSGIQASAVVVTAIDFVSTRNLVFGNIFPNANKTISPADNVNSGRWQITRDVNNNVQVSFTLPTSLTSGTNSLGITFSSTDAGYTQLSDGQSMGSADPNAGFTITDRYSPVFIHIGGKITTSSNQAAGSYSGTVTIKVNYTGI